MKKLLPLAFLSLLQMGLFAQAQRTVLFEEFSGENCGPCAAINPSVNDFVDNHNTEVILLKYQCNIPSAGPLYNQNKPDVNTRLSYYAVNSAPWGQQDGLNFYTGSNHPYYWVNDETILTNRYAVSAPFTIAASHVLSADGDSFYCNVNLTAAQAYTESGSNKLRLRVAMIEDVISFTSPPGNNGETEFHHVMRKMYPNAAGTLLSHSWTNAQTQSFSFSGPIPAYVYDKSAIRFVIFIQDDNNKEVQQAAITSIQHLTNDVSAVSVYGNYYNCNGFTPSFTLTNNGTSTLTSANVNVYIDNTLQTTVPWTGNLAPANDATVNLPQLTPSQGQHTMQIIVSDPNNTTDVNPGKDTATYPFVISVTPAVAPLVEGFEAGVIPTGWAVQNDDNGVAWATAPVGNNSSNSFYLDFYDSPDGAIDYLYTAPLSLSGLDHATVKFDYAYAQYQFSATQKSNDQVDIEVSKDCGAHWGTVWSKAGNTLATTDTSNSFYAPSTAGEWRSDTADISVVANNPNVLLRFKGISNYGNNFFLDNVNIYQYGNQVSGINAVSDVNSLNVYPNPANDVLNAVITLDAAKSVTYSVTNAIGQRLVNTQTEMNAGENMVKINTRNLVSGIYFLSVVIDGKTTVKRFSVAR